MLIGVHDARDTAQELLGTWATLAIWNALIQALPVPQPMGNPFYGFFYKFVNAVGVNIDKLKNK